jgi:hypothetical protein
VLVVRQKKAHINLARVRVAFNIRNEGKHVCVLVVRQKKAQINLARVQYRYAYR